MTSPCTRYPDVDGATSLGTGSEELPSAISARSPTHSRALTASTLLATTQGAISSAENPPVTSTSMAQSARNVAAAA
ncbi:MAG: hypothetical protein ACP5LG_04640 [Conexivisphaera sp.]